MQLLLLLLLLPWVLESFCLLFESVESLQRLLLQCLRLPLKRKEGHKQATLSLLLLLSLLLMLPLLLLLTCLCCMSCRALVSSAIF